YASVEADGALNIGDEVGKDRPHRLKDLSVILAAGGIALQILSLGCRKLKRLHDRLGEAVAADRNRAQPDRTVRSDDEVGVLRADVNNHRRAAGESAVPLNSVVDRERIGLDGLNVQV